MTRRVHLGRRLLIGSVGGVVLAVALAGVLLDRAVGEELARGNAEALESVLDVGCVRAINEARGHRDQAPEVATLFANPAAGPGEGIGATSTYWAVRRDGDDGMLASAKGFPAGIDLRPGSRSATLTEFTAEDGEPYRVLARRVYPAEEMPPRPTGRSRPGPPEGPRGRPGPRGRGPGPGRFRPDEAYDVFVASPIAQERATRARLRRLIGLAGLGTAASLALILALVIRVGFRPVRTLVGAIDGLDAGSLDERLPIDTEVAELAPVTDALRAARLRLLEGFERERRFSGDAAHELRTPLAGLRASLEVALRRERSAPELRDAARECLGITLAMQRTTDALLTLVRPDVGAAAAEDVELLAQFEGAFEQHRSAMAERGQVLRVDGGGGGLTAHAPRALVERLAANAAGNAVAHGAPGGAIDLSAEPTESGVLVRVSNPCATPWPEGGEAHAFDPFWRADGARAVEEGHAGLGLALVRRIVEELGGAARVDVETGSVGTGGADRFTLTLSLPRSPASGPPVP